MLIIRLVNIVYVEYLTDHLAGLKVLHGLDKVVEGGTVVLTIKDQNILADGDINEGTTAWCTFILFQFEVCETYICVKEFFALT